MEIQENKWYDKTWLVILLLVIIFPVGIYALWKSRTISKFWKISVTILVLMVLFSDMDKESSKKYDDTDWAVKNGEQSNLTPSIGNQLTNMYFEINLHDAKVVDKVNTGNQFTNLPREDGNQYLIIDASFKNIDKESRMVIDGKLIIDEYEFDQSETILLEGWGTHEQINPLVTKRTNIVYKIPSNIKGVVYWVPGRSYKNQKFILFGL